MEAIVYFILSKTGYSSVPRRREGGGRAFKYVIDPIPFFTKDFRQIKKTFRVFLILNDFYGIGYNLNSEILN